MKVFIASPLGFADSTRGFIVQVKQKLEQFGFTVIDPWSLCGDLEEELSRAEQLSDRDRRKKELHRISMNVAKRNSENLRSSDGVLAILDGVDVDSGTASEIGYAFGLGGKVINGFRSDFRQSGENDGVLVNLQVQYWIEQSGGKIYTSLPQLQDISF